MNRPDAWPLFLDRLLAQIPDDPATRQEVEELLHEYRGDLMDLVTSAHDQGSRLKVFHHLNDTLHWHLEAIISRTPDLDIPNFPPEVPDAD